jgi:hypothetical protein
MSDSITTSITEQIGFIAPDESYIVFYRYPRSDLDKVGLYISFRKDDDTWTKGKHMGEMFNAPAKLVTQAASLSHDGKYLFFLRTYDEAIYWVDAEVIKQFKKNGFN